MSVIIALLTALFISIAFLASPVPEKTLSPFLPYYATEINFFIKNYLFALVGFIVLTIISLISQEFDKHYSFFKIYTLTTIQTIFAAIISFFLSFILLLVIALVQLNLLALMINAKPEFAGIQSDKNIIADTLKTNNRPPEIIASENDQSKILFAVTSTITGKNNVYGNDFIAAIPTFLFVPIEPPRSSILLSGNALIITQINPSDIQSISPVVGYLFVKDYFPTKKIKSYPKIVIMDREEYFTYRKADANMKLIKIDETIVKIEKHISSISAVLQNTKNIPASNPQLQNAQNEFLVYKYYEEFFKKQRKAAESLKENIPHELGVFVPNDSIKVVLDTTNPHAIADYFETVTHEYLHYASYVSDDQRLDSSFFEEGLTEYFARKLIKNSLHTSTNLGYPVQVKIINEMTNIIPESELADIYFTKDEEGLEAALDRDYGFEFYTSNQILFESLQFTSEPQQVLKLANDIMKKIKGTPLKEEDLNSTFSNL